MEGREGGRGRGSRVKEGGREGERDGGRQGGGGGGEERGRKGIVSQTSWFLLCFNIFCQANALI